MKKFDVFGIGNALVDCVCLVEDSFLEKNNIEKGLMTLVDEKKQKKIIEKINDSKPFIQSGGSVPNSIYTLSQLGGSGYLSILVSEDKYGKIYIDDLKNSGIHTGGKKYTIDEGMTGSCLVLTTPDGERTMNTCLSVSSKFSSKNINFDDLKLSKYLYIEGYLVTSDIAIEAIRKSIEFSKKNNIKIALTFSDLSMVKYFKDKFHFILDNKIDLLFCNEEEALTYSGTDKIEEAYQYLLKFSSMVIITMGGDGSIIINDSGVKIKIEPYKTNLLDTVGAGDTYAGAFLYGINNGMTIKQSGNLASALSSKVISKLGPRLEKSDIDYIKQSLV